MSISNRLLYVSLAVFFVIVPFLLPKSFLGFYQSQVLSSLFIDNFDLEANPGHISIIAYLSLVKCAFVVFGQNLFLTMHILGIFSVLAIFTSYILIFRITGHLQFSSKIVATFYPILFILSAPGSIFAGYVLGFSLLLSSMILYVLVRNYRVPTYLSCNWIILIVCWITLGLFWHTMQVLTMVIVVVYLLLITYASFIVNKSPIKYIIPLVLVLTIFIVTWIYIRSFTLESILGNFTVDFEISKIFSKGSFSNEYAYISQVPTSILDRFRYLSYLITEIIAFIVTIKILSSIKNNRSEFSGFFFLPALFVAQFVVFLLYFIATGSASVMVIVAFVYPTVMLYIISSRLPCSNNALKYILVFFILFPMILSYIGVSYGYIMESPELNIKHTVFDASGEWIMENFDGIREYTDAHTGGNHMITQSQHGNNPEIVSIGYGTYFSILNQQYLGENDLLVINQQLFYQHLIFESLESWNQFEPLNPHDIDINNHFDLLFSDGTISVYSQVSS